MVFGTRSICISVRHRFKYLYWRTLPAVHDGMGQGAESALMAEQVWVAGVAE